MESMWILKRSVKTVSYTHLDVYKRQAQAFAKDLETKEVILTLKVGEGGRTFGSVSAK